MSIWSTIKHAAETAVGGAVLSKVWPVLMTYVATLEAQAAGKYREIPETLKRLVAPSYPGLNLDDVRFAEKINTDHGKSITFGNHIFLAEALYESNVALLLHELEHCRQYAAHGGVVPFLVHYIGEAGFEVIKNGSIDIHGSIPMEKQANKIELRATPSILVEPTFYLERYGDLADAFGSDAEKAVGHWYEYGIAEGRSASPVFSATDYYLMHPDLKELKWRAVIWHWLEFGIAEKRTSSLAFDLGYYLSIHPDLQAAFGSSPEGAVKHWIDFGIAEKRASSPVFDLGYYLSVHPDLQAAFGSSPEGAVKHWFDFGISEGRASAPDFNVQKYVANYSDLQAEFGTNWRGAIIHYLSQGKAEARIGV